VIEAVHEKGVVEDVFAVRLDSCALHAVFNSGEVQGREELVSAGEDVGFGFFEGEVSVLRGAVCLYIYKGLRAVPCKFEGAERVGFSAVPNVLLIKALSTQELS
jgi:hypothetical protein